VRVSRALRNLTLGNDILAKVRRILPAQLEVLRSVAIRAHLIFTALGRESHVGYWLRTAAHLFEIVVPLGCSAASTALATLFPEWHNDILAHFARTRKSFC